MRVYAISDLHIDYEENAKWVSQISRSDFTSDILILGGDVSADLRLMESCFKHLCACFKKVLYVPGNHDLWIKDPSEGNSLDKYFTIKKMAGDHGISLDAHEEGDITIVPLFSWYDYSFAPLNEPIKASWMDFHYCKWPREADEQYVNDFFISLNRDRLHLKNERVISFSHFMPRIDIISRFVPSRFHYIFPVMGSLKLEKHLRILKPDTHIYGHSHVLNDVSLEGINYLCNPYGYPQERYTGSQLKLVHEQ